MTLPQELLDVLPRATRAAWEVIVPAVPEGAYLVGGTAVAVHLGHRQSRDLDFFTRAPFDPDDIAAALSRLGAFEVTRIEAGTLNGLFGDAKLQFLDASDQSVVEPLTDIAGLEVAGLGDLLATKLKVIGDRGELRDYLDVLEIERLGGRRTEEGLGLFVARYRPRHPDQAILHLVQALGFFDDVADDPFLPLSREEIVAHWRLRQPEIVAHLDRWAFSVPPTSAVDHDAVERLLQPGGNDRHRPG